jgi:hypothetical protein
MFFYDPDLAKFGNAVSPIVQMPYEMAQRAPGIPRLKDRYGRWLDQPTAGDWLMASLTPADEFVTGAPAERYEAGPLVSGKTIVAMLSVAALATLIASRNPKHAVDIGAVGVAGVLGTLAWGVGRGE